MSDQRRWLQLGAMALLAALLASCWGSQPQTDVGAPGFLIGFWHGLISPISFLVSLFNERVRIYAFPNVGLWYDFGFMLGIGGFSGGLFAGSRNKKSNAP